MAQPWASGPGEILQHGLSLLRKDSDKNRRLAILAIDNAVELTIKTYLSLPRRVTGINLSRKDYLEISESFPRLLDALEQYAGDKLGGINLGEIEWYHRLRNELYHQGNGLTVDRDKVEVYAELAKLLFRNLFGFDVEIEETEGHEVLGGFLAAWARLEQVSSALILKHGGIGSTGRVYQPIMAVRELEKLQLIDRRTVQEIEELRRIRNEVVHGMSDYKSAINRDRVVRLKEIVETLEKSL